MGRRSASTYGWTSRTASYDACSSLPQNNHVPVSNGGAQLARPFTKRACALPNLPIEQPRAQRAHRSGQKSQLVAGAITARTPRADFNCADHPSDPTSTPTRPPAARRFSKTQPNLARRRSATRQYTACGLELLRPLHDATSTPTRRPAAQRSWWKNAPLCSVRSNAMLSRRRATAVVSANWWDGGRLEHSVSFPLFSRTALLFICPSKIDLEPLALNHWP